MSQENSMKREDSLECAICLQPCMQPVQLPCSHVFCFLCAKGTAMQSRKCALCRSAIPNDFISKPSRFTKVKPTTTACEQIEPRYVWFYQGYNGWWQYDDRTCSEIEAAFNNKAKSIDVLVAGSVYVIDFENEVQYQRNRNSRRRKIKRDLASSVKKGVAGLEATDDPNIPQTSSSTNLSSDSPTHDMDTQLSATNPAPIITHGTMPDVHGAFDRQLPIGSEELQRNQPAGGDGNPSYYQPPPPLIRAATHSVPRSTSSVLELRRHHTYNCYGQASDEPME